MIFALFNWVLNHYFNRIHKRIFHGQDIHMGNAFLINKKIGLNIEKLKLSVGHHNYERYNRDSGSYEDEYKYPKKIYNNVYDIKKIIVM